DEGVLEPVRETDAPSDQQRRHPGVEAVKPDHLRRIQYAQHERAAAIAGRENIGEARAHSPRRLPRGAAPGRGYRLNGGQRAAAVGGDPALDVAEDPLRFIDPPPGGEPPRALRDARP